MAAGNEGIDKLLAGLPDPGQAEVDRRAGLEDIVASIRDGKKSTGDDLRDGLVSNFGVVALEGPHRDSITERFERLQRLVQPGSTVAFVLRSFWDARTGNMCGGFGGEIEYEPRSSVAILAVECFSGLDPRTLGFNTQRSVYVDPDPTVDPIHKRSRTLWSVASRTDVTTFMASPFDYLDCIENNEIPLMSAAVHTSREPGLSNFDFVAEGSSMEQLPYIAIEDEDTLSQWMEANCARAERLILAMNDTRMALPAIGPLMDSELKRELARLSRIDSKRDTKADELQAEIEALHVQIAGKEKEIGGVWTRNLEIVEKKSRLGAVLDRVGHIESDDTDDPTE